MKLFLIILVLFSLFLPLIEAKTVNITKTDFDTEPRQAYKLEQGDGISFMKDNKEYVLSVDEIGKNGVRLKSFAYKNNTRETFYLILSDKYINKIDFEKDDIYDMQLNLLETDDNRTKAIILFEALNEEKPQKEQMVKKDYSQLRTGLIITSFIVILGLLIYFILRRK